MPVENSQHHQTTASIHWLLKLLGAALALFGLIFLLGGIYLIVLGGSFYYLLAGIGFLASGFCLLKGQMTGIWIYLLVFVLTLAWALYEAGLQFWPLVPRLIMPLVLASIALLVTPLVAVSRGRPENARPFVFGGVVLGLVFVAYMSGMFFPHGGFTHKVDVVPGTISSTSKDIGTDWVSYGRNGEAIRFAPIKQINKDNVADLEIAWTAQTGFIADQSKSLQDQNTPIYVDGTLYQCAAKNQVTALDGTTGKIKWQFDPKAESYDWKRCRSLNYFDPGPGDACGPRIVTTTVDARLFAIKTSDGSLCETFGDGGYVNIGLNMGHDLKYLTNSSGAVIAGDKIVLGGRVADNVEIGEPSGVIRAFDAKTGALEWAWDLGNPAIDKAPPAGESYTVGTPNMWALPAFDLDLNLVYIPLGNATPDFYGGLRRDFDDAYTDSIVALSLDKGKEVWKFQTTHHDLWDYDLPSQPGLANIPDGKGGTVPALIQTTKRGEVFVLDRRTGKPLKAVEERPAAAPDGNSVGEYYSKTQPYSVEMEAIRKPVLQENMMWGATPIDQMMCRILFNKHRYDGDFTTPSPVGKSIQFPGNYGGQNVGSVTYDPTRNFLIVAGMEMPAVMTLIPRDKIPPGEKYQGEGGFAPQTGTPYGFIPAMFMSPLGIPCVEPPWGHITAVDLASGKRVWQHPAGTAKDIAVPGLGINNPLPFYLGMPPMLGVLSTEGGLSFHGGNQDYYIRAYDTDTGEVLWKGRLPTGGQATPMSYVGEDGRQYIVITASGSRYNTLDWGDYIVAFALPKK